jgi:hypothetical protein
MPGDAEIHLTDCRRRMASAFVVAVVGVFVAACGSSPPPVPGTLVGAIRFAGGPSNVVIKLRQGGQVRLVRANKVIASSRVRQGQPFHLAAPPGIYELEGRSGDAMCQSKEVTVHAGATSHIDMICDVR